MPIIVPPGGFAGFAQQTPAVQNQFQRAGRIGGRTTQRKRRRSGVRRKKAGGYSGVRTLGKGKLRRRKSRANGKMVKGSPAAKAHMAKLRRMRKR
jgi:hypothetical protein